MFVGVSEGTTGHSYVKNRGQRIAGSVSNYRRQILEVDECGLTKVGRLPFDFVVGACNSFLANVNTQRALLCFAQKGHYLVARDHDLSKACHT